MSIKKRFFGLVMAGLLLSFALLLGMPGGVAQAQCVQGGSDVNCTGADTDGFINLTGGLQIFVAEGASVSNTLDTIVVGDNNTIENNGTVSSVDWRGIYGGVNNVVTNYGLISGYKNGVRVVSGLVVNYGTIQNTNTTTASRAISMDIGGTVINRGTVQGHTGIVFAGTSDDTVITSGTITGLGGNLVAIHAGEGDDTVIIEGGTINGLINGAQDYDRLIFSLELGAGSFDAAYADLQAQLASADPAGGTITFLGESYTYKNFEELLNWLRLAMVRDGRINPFDFWANATGWCAGGGAQFYAIHADGAGEWAFNVTDAQVQAALADAFASGQHVLIGERMGVQLWALADLSVEGVQQLQLMGPDYVHIFPANTCGFSD